MSIIGAGWGLYALRSFAISGVDSLRRLVLLALISVALVSAAARGETWRRRVFFKRHGISATLREHRAKVKAAVERLEVAKQNAIRGAPRRLAKTLLTANRHKAANTRIEILIQTLERVRKIDSSQYGVLTYDLEWLRKELKSYGQARGFSASAAEAQAVALKLP